MEWKERVLATIATVVTLYTFGEILWSLLALVRSKTENGPAIVAVGLMSICLLFAAGYLLWEYLLKPRLFRDFAIRNPRKVKKIVFEQTRTYALRASGTDAVLESHMIFLTEPEEGDRIDMFDVEGQEFPAGFSYESPDSTELRREMPDESRLKIYWEPKTTIKPYVPYTHTKRYFFPDDYDSAMDGGYVFDILSDVPNGRVVLDVTTHEPISHAVVVPYPRFRRLKTIKSVFCHGLESSRTLGPPPSLKSSNRLTWEGTSFDVGRRYALIVYYRGYRDAVGPCLGWFQRLVSRDALIA